MYRTLLVGLDRSENHAAVLDLAIRWADRLGAMLEGFAVVDEPDVFALEPARPIEGMYAGYEARLQSEWHEARVLLDEFAARCREAGVPCRLKETIGPPAERLVREVQTCDAIVLGQRGRLRFQAQDGPDDTLTKVLRATPRPMIVVPPGPRPEGPALIAFAGSRQAAHALAAFRDSGLAAGAEVHVLSVAADADEAADLAALAAAYLGGHGIAAIRHAIASAASPVGLILALAEEIRAGLLVLGAYGRSAVREVFLGSTTRALLEGSPVPMFLDH